MATKKINPFSKANDNTGFGVQSNQVGGRFVNKDGSYNLRKEGWPLLKRLSIYSQLLTLPGKQFLAVVLLFYLFMNILFTGLYLLAGFEQFGGLLGQTPWDKTKELFFFSTETFTTVGYGRINPVKDGAHVIASIESMTALLSFAIVTGLLYGRFTRPKAYVAFTERALISPYHGRTGLMFRMVPYKIGHHLTNATVQVSVALTEPETGEFKFYNLALERSHIDSFTMNWTVVHPIDEESPFLNLTPEDLKRSEAEIYVMVTGFDHIFSNTVMQRTSFTYSEITWGARFTPMYRESEDGNTTIVELHKLNAFESVQLPEEAKVFS